MKKQLTETQARKIRKAKRKLKAMNEVFVQHKEAHLKRELALYQRSLKLQSRHFQ